MEIRKRDLLRSAVGLVTGLAASRALAQETEGGGAPGGSAGNARGGNAPVNSDVQPTSVDMNYKPRRINKVIELWEDGQPIYYTGPGLMPGMDPYLQGKKMAKTYADCINYGLEHGPLDFTAFANFMRGLKDGGPTKSGHATPAVFVEPPCTGHDEQYAIANSWIVSNLLDLGAHGVHICHARDPKAIEVYCQMAARFSCDYPDTPKVTRQGQGLRGQPPGVAPGIWGVSSSKYMHIADVWPLNPRGEIMIGCKIEDTFADAKRVETLAVKGLAFAEWGPTDNTQSLFGLAAYPEDATGRSKATPEQAAVLADIRTKVLAECRKNNIRFLDGGGDVIDLIKKGSNMIPGSEENAIKGREFTKRKMPV